MNMKRKKGKTMNDLISRRSAIDALDVLCQEHRYKIPGKIETYSQYNEAWQDALDRAEGAIFNLPSAQPEIIRCKDCKNWDRTWKSERPNYHYCPIIDGIRNGFWYCADGDRRGICNE